MEGQTHTALRQLPNALTTLRLFLAIPICLFILQGHFTVVLWITFFAGLSDVVDGWLARKLDAQTRYGAIADPLSDKAMLIGTYVCLAVVGLIPQWVAMLVVARDLIIMTGALAYHWLIGHYDMSPSFWGKACTLVQIAFALMVIVQQVFPVFSDTYFRAALWLVLALTLISGGNYVSVWGKKALQEWSSRNTPGQ